MKEEVTQNWNQGKCVKGNRKASPYPQKVERGNSSVGYSGLGSDICGMKPKIAWGLSGESGRGTAA